MRQISTETISSPLKQVFAISRGSKTSAETLRVSITESGKTGRGECVPYARYNESVESVTAQIKSVKAKLENGRTTEDLQLLLPPGAARCAIDCALWDLRSKLEDKPVWQLADLPEPKPLPTTMTLSLDSADAMAEAAKATPASILKLKLGGEDDLERLRAVHSARPDAKLILDGNEALQPEAFPDLAKAAGACGAVLIEQPFPAGEDDALLRRPGFVSVCADESVHTRRDLQALAKKYDSVNIKLDKAGGFTEALAMIREARHCGLGVMIGCMVAGSLSMAPALTLGSLADFVDLDGPLWLQKDIQHGLVYKDGHVMPPSPKLWG